MMIAEYHAMRFYKINDLVVVSQEQQHALKTLESSREWLHAINNFLMINNIEGENAVYLNFSQQPFFDTPNKLLLYYRNNLIFNGFIIVFVVVVLIF